MDNPETLATLGTQDKEKQERNQHLLKGVYHIIRVDFNQSYVVGVFLGGEVG